MSRQQVPSGLASHQSVETIKRGERTAKKEKPGPKGLPCAAVSLLNCDTLLVPGLALKSARVMHGDQHSSLA